MILFQNIAEELDILGLEVEGLLQLLEDRLLAFKDTRQFAQEAGPGKGLAPLVADGHGRIEQPDFLEASLEGPALVGLLPVAIEGECLENRDCASLSEA